MSLNESTIEAANLEWFGEQCRVAPTLIPAFLLVRQLREAILRLNPAVPSRALITLLPKLLSVAELQN